MDQELGCGTSLTCANLATDSLECQSTPCASPEGELDLAGKESEVKEDLSDVLLKPSLEVTIKCKQQGNSNGNVSETRA